MGDTGIITNSGDPQTHTDSIITTLTNQMTKALSKVQVSTSTTENLTTHVVEMYISGKDKLGYINGDYPPPSQADPSFQKWLTDNAIVKGWLINSMDPTLIGNFIRFSTAKSVWDVIAVDTSRPWRST